MTREEAKEELIQSLTDNHISDPEAVEMAIKALEQKPCGDMISRQAVLDEAFEVDTKEYGRIDVVGVDAINSLPPVTSQPKYEDIAKAFQFGLAFGFGKKYEEIDKVIDEIKKVCTPQPKMGRWIIIDDCEYFMAKCSECGELVDSRMINKYPYCHCGAKMQEVEDGNDD